MNNEKQMTLVEALCIKEQGWGTEEERLLHGKASSLISKEAQRLHLEYQKQLIEKKLQNLEGESNEP
jgi:hypothetical protein